VTYLVCLNALHEAYRELEGERLKCREDAHALTTIRETLDQVLELACQRQSFGPLASLFDEEEAALAVYERALIRVKNAEQRWTALSLALSHEKERLSGGLSSPNRIN
jgi:hypothetical protein